MSQRHPLPQLFAGILLWLGCITSLTTDAADARPLLWRVAGPVPVYLFGTIHSAHPELNRLPESVSQAFDRADSFYGELPLDGATQARAQTLFMLPPGQRLSDQLDRQHRQRINRVLAAIDPQLNLDTLNALRLWAFTLTLALLEDQLTYAGAPMMDLRLYQAATAQGKQTGGLETPEEQVAVFEQLDRDEQLALLDATLGYLEATHARDQSSSADSYRIYREGDPNQFLALFGEQMDVPLLLKLKLQRLLLNERNQRMAERIDRLISANPQQRLFIAVGAAHFTDHGGVPSRLRERGYNVHRVEE